MQSYTIQSSGLRGTEVTVEDLVQELAKSVSQNRNGDQPIFAEIFHRAGIFPQSYYCVVDDIVVERDKKRSKLVVFKSTGSSITKLDDYDLCTTPIRDFRGMSLGIEPNPDIPELRQLQTYYLRLERTTRELAMRVEKIMHEIPTEQGP